MSAHDGATSGAAAPDDAPPAVTVEQLDVRDGTGRRWTFHTAHTADGAWWSIGPSGDRSEPADSLRAALRASDALDPLPWHAIVIEAWPHTSDVLAELGPRIVGRGERAVLDAAWHPSVVDIDGMHRELVASQSTWFDTEVPVVLDYQTCGALAGPGGPFAFAIAHSDEDGRVTVWFHEQWLGIEVLAEWSRNVVAGELAPGRFAVEWTDTVYPMQLDVDADPPVGPVATQARLRSVLEHAIGLKDLSLLERFVVKDDGRFFRGSFGSGRGRVEFDGFAAGPGVDLIRSLAREREAATRTD